jgi:hypothetical protein
MELNVKIIVFFPPEAGKKQNKKTFISICAATVTEWNLICVYEFLTNFV